MPVPICTQGHTGLCHPQAELLPWVNTVCPHPVPMGQAPAGCCSGHTCNEFPDLSTGEGAEGRAVLTTADGVWR